MYPPAGRGYGEFPLKPTAVTADRTFVRYPPAAREARRAEHYIRETRAFAPRLGSSLGPVPYFSPCHPAAGP